MRYQPMNEESVKKVRYLSMRYDNELEIGKKWDIVNEILDNEWGIGQSKRYQSMRYEWWMRNR